METTLSAIVLAGTQAYVAHIGDTRVYHWRDGHLAQLTSDHSEAAELVRMRILKPDKVKDHPGRSSLTRTLGSRLIPRPDYLRHPIQPEDQFLMCSDGLWSELEESELSEVLAGNAPQAAAQTLIDMALERDCHDNVSVQVIRVVSVDAAEPGRNGWLSSIFRQRGQS
jgi:PPM family protein phosphatase